MNDNVIMRQATSADTPAVFRLFLRTVRDLAFRQGIRAALDGVDPEEVAIVWEQRRSMFEHLERTGHRFWVAEKDSEIIGYARSILRDGALELTEFFVSPDEQSGGIGRELLRQVFTSEMAKRRVIIATSDIRAQARYLKTGVYPRFPIYYFSHKPQPVDVNTDLSFEDIDRESERIRLLGDLDATVLGYRRDVDHDWFLENRRGYIYYRLGEPVGYGYISRGHGSGPFALLDPLDFPAILAHAESVADRVGLEEFGVQVPMVNRTAVDYLLRSGFRMDPFVTLYMSDGDEDLHRYLVTSPPFFV